MIFEYTSANWIDRVKDNRKEILNAEKAKDIQRFEANDFEFIEKSLYDANKCFIE